MTKAVREKIPGEPETDRNVSLQEARGQDQMEINDLRREKIRAVMIEALGRTDPTEATLGAATSDLMDLAFRLKQDLDESHSQKANATEKFQQLMPMIQMYLKLTGQIARYVDVQRLLARPN